MQNRYVGDVGDFAKHGLLRFLSGMTDAAEPEPKLRPGLIWYMFPDERHGLDRKKISGDGKFVDFLKPTEKDDKHKYRDCDPDLWELLRDLVLRDVDAFIVPRYESLPGNTLYYNAPLHFPRTYSGQLVRRFAISGWPVAAPSDEEGGFGLCGPGQRHCRRQGDVPQEWP